MWFLFPILAFFGLTLPAAADGPVIENATAEKVGDTWTFTVTVSHPDTGWEHYANGFRILDLEGKELGLRVLWHPHETEQPFTRSLTGVEIPSNLREVQVQGRCIVDGWSDHTFLLKLE